MEFDFELGTNWKEALKRDVEAKTSFLESKMGVLEEFGVFTERLSSIASGFQPTVKVNGTVSVVKDFEGKLKLDLKVAIHPQGNAPINYWYKIGERYRSLFGEGFHYSAAKGWRFGVLGSWMASCLVMQGGSYVRWG